MEIASMIQRSLREKGHEVEAAHDGYIGLRFAEEKEFDAIILDLNLPLMNGYEICRRIRETDDKVFILILTAYSTIDNKLEGFDVGADDYLTKPFDLKELHARLQAALKRKLTSESQQKVIRVADLQVDLYHKKVIRDGKEIALTAKEFHLLEYLIKNKNRIVSKDEIAEKVWDVHFDTGTNIVEVYMNYLRKKVDRDFSQKLLHTVIGMGYILKEE
jgi:two-component system, OmpR family, copper resistance phosphate regulon response regulator CusR